MTRTKFKKEVVIVTYLKEKEKIYYLLLKRKLHWKGWEFPKGGIEKGENLKDAAKRELKEETGHYPKELKTYPLSGKYRYKNKLEDKSIIGQEFRLFSARISSRKIKIDRNEHSEFKFLPYEKAIRLLTYKDQRDCLKKVNSRLS